MEICSKMKDCGTCTRSQFWMGDNDRRQFLTQQQGVCWKEREETEGRKGADSAVSRRQAGKKSKERGCGLKNKEYNFKLDSEANRAVSEGLEMHERQIFSMRDRKRTLGVVVTLCHCCTKTSLCCDCWSSVPEVCIYLLGKTLLLWQCQQHSAENRCGSTSWVRCFATHSSSPAVALIMHKDVQVQPTDSLFVGAALWGTLQAFGGSHSRSHVVDAFSYRPEDVPVTFLPSCIKTGKFPTFGNWTLA